METWKMAEMPGKLRRSAGKLTWKMGGFQAGNSQEPNHIIDCAAQTRKYHIIDCACAFLFAPLFLNSSSQSMQATAFLPCCSHIEIHPIRSLFGYTSSFPCHIHSIFTRNEAEVCMRWQQAVAVHQSPLATQSDLPMMTNCRYIGRFINTRKFQVRFFYSLWMMMELFQLTNGSRVQPRTNLQESKDHHRTTGI
jgi:hypothetical protein